jgi:hypothetical protein
MVPSSHRADNLMASARLTLGKNLIVPGTGFLTEVSEERLNNSAQPR